MDVLMLVHLAVHVGVCVRMYVRVDLGVDLGGHPRAALAQQQLLLCQVLLVVHGAHGTLLLWAGGAGRGGGAASLPVPVGQPGVWALQALGGWGAGRRAVLLVLTEPQQHHAQDEHQAGGDADDHGPGQRVGGRGEDGRGGRLGVWGRRGQGREGVRTHEGIC